MVRCLVLLSFSLAGLLAAGTAVAQPATPSRCADCHFARPDAPGQYHVLDWDRSPHGRNNVGCQACHGGDATTFESLLAHRDIQHPSAPASPLNPRIPITLGKIWSAFIRSPHAHTSSTFEIAPNGISRQ